MKKPRLSSALKATFLHFSLDVLVTDTGLTRTHQPIHIMLNPLHQEDASQLP